MKIERDASNNECVEMVVAGRIFAVERAIIDVEKMLFRLNERRLMQSPRFSKNVTGRCCMCHITSNEYSLGRSGGRGV